MPTLNTAPGKHEEQSLIDRAIVTASPEAYAEFLARLDMPPSPNERLRKTMQTPAPWGKA